jgi:opacity protein-like surface antigen
MKRMILIGLVLVSTLMLSTSLAFADTPEKSVYFGLKLGLNVADVDGSVSAFGLTEDLETDTRLGFCGGVFVSIALSEWFAIQPEILYSMKGENDRIGDGALELHYIELPILAKLTIPTQSVVTPTLFLGPAVSFNVDAKAKAFGQSVDIGDYVGTIDVGLTFGGGVDFALGSVKLILDGRYTLGLVNVADFPSDASSILGVPGASLDVKNRTISFMVGLGF